MEKVNGNPPVENDGYLAGQRLALLTGNTIIILMMMCTAVGIVQFGTRLSPLWQGSYLVWLVMFIAMEAIFTRQHARKLEGRARPIFHISEWIAFAVAVKILLYLVNDPTRFLEDLPRWQENFFENFFTGEYVLVMLICLGVWLLARTYAGELEELYEREKDADWDELGKLQNALSEIRGKIASKVFFIGVGVVGLAIAARIDASALLRSGGRVTVAYHTPVVNVLFYFVLALVLLSQTQFALLRTRWRFQHLPIAGGIARNWIRFGLLFFVVLAVVVFFLPTEYSLNLLDTLRYALGFLAQLSTFLMMLIMLPFTWCLSLFRFAGNQDPGVPESQPALPPPTAAVPSQPIAWLEFLRSLFFWVIFIGIIFFAVRYYLSQNAALWNAIRAFPLFRWIAGALGGIWAWLKGANRQFRGFVRDSMQRIQPKKVELPTQAIRRFFNLGRLSPREKIIYFYLNLIRLGGERGLDRRPAQTPYQYEQRLTSAVPEIDQDLHGLTDAFIEARYSPHSLDEPEADRANSLWEHIKSVLRSWRKDE